MNSSEEKIKNFTKAMSNLIAQDSSKIHDVVSRFLQTHGDSLNDWINHIVAYAGFNAELMRAKLLKKGSLDLIILCCLVGMLRGNNIDRIIATIKSKELKALFRTAIVTFRLRKSASGDFDAVTLSRMIYCFPDVVLTILQQFEIQKPDKYHELLSIHSEYPRVSRHPVCAGIIPNNTLSNADINKALDVLLVPYIKLSEVIYVKNAAWNRKSKDEKIQEAARCLLISYRSRLLSSAVRIKYAAHFGIIANSGLSAVWNSVAKKAKQYLKTNYSYSFTEQDKID